MSARLSGSPPPVVMAVVCLLGCSRHPAVELPNRVVDDPVTLPARMMALSTVVSFDRALEAPRRLVREDALVGDLRWGITDRLEYRLPGELTYSLLDERPVDRRRPAPFSLALLGGFGLLTYGPESAIGPSAGLRTGKRIFPAVALWVEGRATAITQVTPEVAVTGTHWSGFVGTTVQVVPRVALTLGSTAAVLSGRQLRWGRGYAPERGRWLTVNPAATVRARLAWWLDLTASGGVSRKRFRPQAPELSSPDDHLPERPNTWWVPHASLSAILRW